MTRSKGKVSPIHIMLFTRQLATMMKAGVPLVQAYEIVGEGQSSQPVRELVKLVSDDVAAGDSLADSIRRHPRYFDSLFCALVEAGELSGTLDVMLDRLACHREKSEALKARVRKAMNYPLTVVVTAVAVTGVLLVKVVPQFAETFAGFGAELPAFTLLVLNLSEVVTTRWWQALLTMAAAVLLFRRMRQRSVRFATALDRHLLRLPVIGRILHHSCCARFTRTLATVFAAGVPLVDALDSVTGSAGNRIYAAAVRDVKEAISSGSPLSLAIHACGLFPRMVTQMVRVGEESGTLDTMLERCAAYYEAAVDETVDRLIALLEPMIMLVLGGLVGGLMVAMYLPIFRLGQVM